MMMDIEISALEMFSPMSNLGANFGLPAGVSIDEIIVKWPSGVITVLENPEANMVHTIPEAECLADDIEIVASGATSICPGETLEITAPMGGDSYTWSNGEDSNVITVTESGIYSLAMYDEEGCVSLSNNIMVEVLTEEIPEISIQGETQFCEGGSVILTSSEAAGYTWSNDSQGQSIEVTESGSYFVSISGICYDETSETIDVLVLATSSPEAADVDGSADEDIVLNGTGSGTLTWYSDADATNALGTGASYTIPGGTLTENTSYWVTNTEEYPGAKMIL